MENPPTDEKAKSGGVLSSPNHDRAVIDWVMIRVLHRCIPMLPVMQVGRVRPGAPPEHDVLHPVGGGLGQARPTNNIGIHGYSIVVLVVPLKVT